MQRLTAIWPADVDMTRVSVFAGKGKDDAVVINVSGVDAEEFGCGNCGTVLVIGDPRKKGWELEQSVLIRCSACGALNTPDVINHHFAGRRLTIEP